MRRREAAAEAAVEAAVEAAGCSKKNKTPTWQCGKKSKASFYSARYGHCFAVLKDIADTDAKGLHLKQPVSTSHIGFVLQ